MTQNLKTNIKTKLPLRFNEDGKFKILTISDIQETTDFDKTTMKAIEQLLDNEKPDLVLLLGDNCNGLVVKSEESLRKFADILDKPFRKRKIPYAHIWGNHDHDVGIDEDLQQSIYSRHRYCLSRSAKGVTGQSNFVLPIYSHDGTSIRFAAWGLDSGNTVNDFADTAFEKDYDLWGEIKDLEDPNPCKSIWGPCTFDRVSWYFNSSIEMEKYNKAKIPALMVTHMAPQEVTVIVRNKEKCGTVGCTEEMYGVGAFNNGLFLAMMQRGDVKAICAGHSHYNDQYGKYCGIAICNDGSIGYRAYGDNERRGGRVFEIDENDPQNFTTRMVYSKV